jgi:competence protein ComEA
MPFRRPVPEPSPRLLAVLRGTGGGPAPPGGSARDGSARDGSARGRSAGDPLPWGWVPAREDIAPAEPTGGTGSGGRDRTGQCAARRGYAGRHRSGPPPIVAVPRVLREARYAVSVPAVLAVLVIVALGVAGFGGRLLLAERSSAGATGSASETSGGVGTVTPGSSGAQGALDDPGGDRAEAGGAAAVGQFGDRAAFDGAGGTTGGTAGATSPAPDAVGAEDVVVHVVGQVREPGVVTLRAGARVEDALRAAGGATGRADLARVNLARPVLDGEQIVVPAPGEEIVPVPPVAGSIPTAGEGGAAGPVNLNTAGQVELEELPGVGPVLAGRIIAWRTEHGGFTSVSELVDVSGIGEVLMGRLADLVTV